MEQPIFSARKLNEIDNGKGYWKSSRVGIFKGEEQIGEYDRNYHSHTESTFFPFKQDDKWYALYSKFYTSTRLMSLPDCKDIGGEDKSKSGFCPVEYYVPEITFRKTSESDPPPKLANHDTEKWANTIKKENEYTGFYWPDDKQNPNYSAEKEKEYLEDYERTHKLHEEWDERNPYVTDYANFGFVAGCIWGDDCSWKIEFLDLTRVSEGIIHRDNRFGYIELPSGIRLKGAIDTRHITRLKSFDKMNIKITIPVLFNLNGKRLKDDD